MKEEWRRVEECPRYLVSNHGRVFSTISGKVLTPCVRSKNSPYLYVNLCHIGGCIRKENIHRLVAKAFIPNPENKPEVNHIDGDKKNNHLSNLEWVSKSENALHAFKCHLRKSTDQQIHFAIDATKVPVRNVTTGEVFQSLSDAARAIGGQVGGVSKCVTGQRKRYKGMQFEYYKAVTYGS